MYCRLSLSYRKIDFTREAQWICQGVQQLSAREEVTLLHLGEVLKGSMNAKIVEKSHNSLEMHAKMAKYKKVDIERFLRKLIFASYLKVLLSFFSFFATLNCIFFLFLFIFLNRFSMFRKRSKYCLIQTPLCRTSS